MPYALIPDGYKLRKVTAAQKAAVNDLKRHEDIKTILSNPETIAIVATLLSGAFVTKKLLALDLPDIPNQEEIKKKVAETYVGSVDYTIAGITSLPSKGKKEVVKLLEYLSDLD
tara:strand:+ start:226 stop:567 length:342 start_codon:yes stop_codon:yes gene_type:complete